LDDQYRILQSFDPDDPNDPNGDRLTLASLASAGSDLTKPTQFIHFLTFNDEEHSDAAGRALAGDLGYGVIKVPPHSNGQLWSLHATVARIPTLENVSRMRRVMEAAAERYGGQYEGWEAAIQRGQAT
jgi:Regulator of ribonuclease activity B